MKIPLSDVILENRYQKVTHATPPVESKLFKVVEQAWKHPFLWNQITRMVFAGRILGGFNGVIESLPLFMSGWSEGRNTAIPPKKSFRQWFETDDAQALLETARAEGIPRNNLAQEGK